MKLRLQGQRAGDADPLALAARELVRKTLAAVARQADHARAAPRRAVVDPRRLSVPATSIGSAMASPTRMRGFSELCGSWKTNWTRLRRRRECAAGTGTGQRLAEQAHRAGGGRNQPDQHPARRGLAGAGLADQAERLARAMSKSTPSHGMQEARRLADPALQREGLGQLANRDDRLGSPGLQAAAAAVARGSSAAPPASAIGTGRRCAAATRGGQRLARAWSRLSSGGGRSRQAGRASGQRGLKRQPGMSSAGSGMLPGIACSRPAGPSSARNGGQQAVGVRMHRRVEQRFRRARSRSPGRHTSPRPGRRTGRSRRDRG